MRRLTEIRSIRSKIRLSVTLLCLGIVAAITVTVSRVIGGFLRENAQVTAARMVGLGVDSLARFLDAREASAHYWSTIPAVRNILAGNLPEFFEGSLLSFLEGVHEREPWLRSVVIISKEKIVFDDAALRGISVTRDIDSLLSLSEGRFSVAESQDGATDLAFRLDLEKQSSMIVFIDPHEMYHNLFGNSPLGVNGFFALAAQGRKLRAWVPDANSAEIGEFLRMIEASSKEDSLAVFGSSIMLTRQRLRETPLAVVGVSSLRDAEAPVRRLVLMTIGVGILMGLVALLISQWIASRLSRPLIRLADEVRHYSVGRGTIAVMSDSKDEVGQLSRSFSELTVRLGTAYDDIRQRSEMMERLRLQLEQVLVATRDMSTAHSRFEALSTAVAHLIFQVPGFNRCALEVVLHDITGSEAPYRCYRSVADQEAIRLVRTQRHLSHLNLSWQEVPLPADGSLYDARLEVSAVADSVRVSGDVIRLLAVWNKDLRAILTVRCDGEPKVDDSCVKFLSTLANSLGAGLQSIANAEWEARRRVEEQERAAAAEQKRLKDLLSLSAELSDKLNSPLLTVVNVIERLEKSPLNASDTSSEGQLREFGEVWRRCRPLLVDAKGRIVVIRGELEALRERQSELEPTSAFSSRSHS